jgi:hypothetical protein
LRQRIQDTGGKSDRTSDYRYSANTSNNFQSARGHATQEAPLKDDDRRAHRFWRHYHDVRGFVAAVSHS